MIPTQARAQARVRRAPRADYFITQAADVATLIAVAMAPCLGLRAGSLPLTEFFVVFALMFRGLQFLGGGIDREELRHHTFMFAVTGIFCVGGLVTDTFYGEPLAFDLGRAVLTSVGGVLLVATYGTTPERRKHLVTALALGGTVLAASSFFMGSINGRALGLSTHPNLLAHSCLMGVFSALWCADNERRPQLRLFWMASAMLGLGAIFVSGSRGTLLGAALGMVTYCLIGRRYRLVLAVVGVAYLVFVLSIAGVVNPPTDSAIGRLTGGGGSSLADQEREQGLHDNLRTIAQFPVFGIGFLPQANPKDNYLYSHVVYLQAWLTSGFMGGVTIVLLGLLMLILPIGQPQRVLALACGAMGVAVAWFVTNIFLARDQWIYLPLAFRMCYSPLRSRLPVYRPIRARRSL